MYVPAPGLANVLAEALAYNTEYVSGNSGPTATPSLFQRLRLYRSSDVFQPGGQFNYWTMHPSNYPIFKQNPTGGPISTTNSAINLNFGDNDLSDFIKFTASGSWSDLRYVAYEVARSVSSTGQPNPENAVNNSTVGNNNYWRTLAIMTLPGNGTSGIGLLNGESLRIQSMIINCYTGGKAGQTEVIYLTGSNSVTNTQANALTPMCWGAYSQNASDATQTRWPIYMKRVDNKLYINGPHIVYHNSGTGPTFWSHLNLFTAQTGGSVYKALNVTQVEAYADTPVIISNSAATGIYIDIV